MARRSAPAPSVGEDDANRVTESDLVDEALEETFPASDPSASWAGPDWDSREAEAS